MPPVTAPATGIPVANIWITEPRAAACARPFHEMYPHPLLPYSVFIPGTEGVLVN